MELIILHFFAFGKGFNSLNRDLRRLFIIYTEKAVITGRFPETNFFAVNTLCKNTYFIIIHTVIC